MIYYKQRRAVPTARSLARFSRRLVRGGCQVAAIAYAYATTLTRQVLGTFLLQFLVSGCKRTKRISDTLTSVKLELTLEQNPFLSN